jgi:hypothetical protein
VLACAGVLFEPIELIQAVRAKELRHEHFTASLRTYQRFAAQFALTQEKVVIGDEVSNGLEPVRNQGDRPATARSAALKERS